MTPDRDQIGDKWDQLKANLDEMGKHSPAEAASLHATLGEARAVLGGKSADPAAHRSIVERLSDALVKYEASHPVLAENLGSIISALGQIGI